MQVLEVEQLAGVGDALLPAAGLPALVPDALRAEVADALLPVAARRAEVPHALLATGAMGVPDELLNEPADGLPAFPRARLDGPLEPVAALPEVRRGFPEFEWLALPVAYSPAVAQASRARAGPQLAWRRLEDVIEELCM